MSAESGIITVLLAMFAGAIRVSTPFLFVSLGECLTEKSGRINLGLEGTLVFGAMTGYAISYQTASRSHSSVEKNGRASRRMACRCRTRLPRHTASHCTSGVAIAQATRTPVSK